MKLYDPQSDQLFDVAFVWPSASARKAINIIDEQHVSETHKVIAEYRDAYDYRQIEDLQERNKQALEKPDVAIRSGAYSTAITTVNDRAVIKTCQAALRRSLLTPYQVELLNSDPDSDFWQSQDWGVLKQISERFRNACSTGRRANPVDPDVEDSALETTAEQNAAGNSGAPSPAHEVAPGADA